MANEKRQYPLKHSELFLYFSHKDIKFLSDHTLNTLNRGFRKICQEIIEYEVNLMIAKFDLAEKYKQSLRDRIKPKIASGNKYYVQDVKKGSYELIVMLSALASSLLVWTLGEDIKKIWQNTRSSKKFREMMGEDLTKTDVKTIISNIQDYNKQREEIIPEYILKSFESKKIGNSFSVKEISIEQHKNGTMVKIEIKTIRKAEEEKFEEIVDSVKVNEDIKKLLDSIK